MIKKQLSNKPRSWYENPNALAQPLNQYAPRKQKVNFMWVAKDSTRKVTILDEKPIANFRFHIDADNNYEKVMCIQQHDNCPVCAVSDGKGRFGRSKQYILITVIDETPWTTKEGREITHSRKVLAIENEKQRKVIQKYAEKYGTTRGLVFEFMRTGEKGEGACGIPTFEELLSEEDLVAKFDNAEIKAEDGRVIKEAHADLKPFDYGKMFPLPTATQLRSQYNISAPIGAEDTESEEYDELPFDEDATDDDNPYM